MKMKRLLPLLTVTLLVSGCGKADVSNQKTESNETQEAAANAQDDVKTNELHKDDVVEGNGTFFVSVNDKVYFRKYDAETFSDASLNSEYTNLWRGGLTTEYSKKSEICAYDPKTKQVETIAEDDGCHEIYYLDGLFYLTKKEDDRFKTYTLPKMNFEGKNGEIDINKDSINFSYIIPNYKHRH